MTSMQLERVRTNSAPFSLFPSQNRICCPQGQKNTSGGKNYYQCDKTKISLVECQAGYWTFPRHMFNELIRQRLQKNWIGDWSLRIIAEIMAET